MTASGLEWIGDSDTNTWEPEPADDVEGEPVPRRGGLTRSQAMSLRGQVRQSKWTRDDVVHGHPTAIRFMHRRHLIIDAWTSSGVLTSDGYEAIGRRQ